MPTSFVLISSILFTYVLNTKTILHVYSIQRLDAWLRKLVATNDMMLSRCLTESESGQIRAEAQPIAL